MAALTLDQLVVKVTADIKPYEVGLKKAVVSTKKAEKQIITSTSNIKKGFEKLGAAISIAAIGLFAKRMTTSFIDAGRTVENFQIKLKVLLGSVEEGKKVFNDMAKFASRVAFEFEDIMSAAVQMATVLKGGAEEINKFMPLIADIAAATGIGIEKTAEQFVRAFSAGIGAAELFKEKGVTAALGFQVGAKVSAEETRKAFVNALNDMNFKFKDAAKEMESTWDGTMSMISDKWFQVRTKINEAGLFEELKKDLKFIDVLFQRGIDNANKIGKVFSFLQKLNPFALMAKGQRKLNTAIRDTILRTEELKEKSKKAIIDLGEILVTETVEETFFERILNNIKNGFDEMRNKSKLAFLEIKNDAKISTQAWADFMTEKLLDLKFNFSSLGDFAKLIFRDIMRRLIQINIVNPAVNQLSKGLGFLFGGGMFKPAARANGGDLGAGQLSLVGERGPELFVPQTAGAVIPNEQLGGKTVNIVQNMNFSMGVVETVRSEIQNAAPIIASQARNAVFADIERGGAQSKSVRRRR